MSIHRIDAGRARRRIPFLRLAVVLRSTARIGVVLFSILLSSCTIEVLTPTPKPTTTHTPTPELPLTSLLPTLETIPTETATQIRTSTPGILLPEEAGQRIFFDSFDDTITGWTVTKTEAGTVDYSSGMLVFTANSAYTSLVSIVPRDFPDDVYIEAKVQTLLCGEGLDVFGIIYRDSKDYSYRYAVTCVGLLRFERFKEFTMEGRSAWIETLGLLPGAPATHRIGVMVKGRIFRFFVGGIEVFSGHDPVSYSGGIGLFVRTEKSDVLSVGFEEISVYSLSEN